METHLCIDRGCCRIKAQARHKPFARNTLEFIARAKEDFGFIPREDSHASLCTHSLMSSTDRDKGRRRCGLALRSSKTSMMPS